MTDIIDDTIESEDELVNDYYRLIYNNGYMVPKLKLSTPLYRYRGNLDFAIDEIENSYIYLSPIDNLNDPFDSSCKISFEEAMEMEHFVGYFWNGCYYLRNRKWYNDIDQIIRQNDFHNQLIKMRDFFDFLVEEVTKRKGSVSAKTLAKTFYKVCDSQIHRRSYGNVASFSEKGDSLTMWAYYADSHKGMCLKYEPCMLDMSKIYNQHLVDSINKVWYSDNRLEDKDGLCTPFIKANEWAHEQEWRLFRKIGKNKIRFPCLTEVYLGINFDFEYIDNVIDAIKKSGQDIKLFHYGPSQQYYTLEARKIII